MNEQIKIDPAFRNVFMAWFNVDVVNLRDREDVESAAGACASDLSGKVHNLDELITDLSTLLREWNPQIVMWFCDVTHTDWFFDDETEDTLKSIINEVIKELRFQKSRR